MTNLELALVLEALSGLKYSNLRDSGEHPRSRHLGLVLVRSDVDVSVLFRWMQVSETSVLAGRHSKDLFVLLVSGETAVRQMA